MQLSGLDIFGYFLTNIVYALLFASIFNILYAVIGWLFSHDK